MKYASKNNERESDSTNVCHSPYSSTRQGNVAKRLLVLLLMTISLVFAGAQSAPTTNASARCELICSDPYIDPSDGQCYIACCPPDDQIKCPCERRPCK
jgi:hypothetical protein